MDAGTGWPVTDLEPLREGSEWPRFPQPQLSLTILYE